MQHAEAAERNRADAGVFREFAPRRFARDGILGLPENAARHAAEGRDSRLSRVVKICDAFGLALTVTSPADDATADAPPTIEALRLLVESK